MKSNLLVRLFGFPATLIHGDTLVADRWRWLERKLPPTQNNEKLLDVGCGSGAFTIGASIRGYFGLGLSWDSKNSETAKSRAKLCNAKQSTFETFDVRDLLQRTDLHNQFDVAICCENIEHIIDDFKLMRAIYASLKPGARLLLTAPNFYFKPMSGGDLGPFRAIEDGGHVRRGYSKAMLEELCEVSGFKCEEISFCSGFLSQKITSIQCLVSKLHPFLGWIVILPLRAFPRYLDGFLTNFLNWPHYSICLVAYKPRQQP